VVARLHQIVDFWASKAVFDAGGAAEMKAAASSGHATPPPTAHYQQQQQQQQYAAQQQQQQQQPGQPYWDGQQWVTPLAGYGQPAPGVSPHTSPHQVRRGSWTACACLSFACRSVTRCEGASVVGRGMWHFVNARSRQDIGRYQFH